MEVDDHGVCPPVEITMLGGFCIRVGDRVADDGKGHSRQLWTLLAYLIANRHAVISQEKLIDVLWGGGECLNPANALKNLVYRLRLMLTEMCGDGYDFIPCRQNHYSWNNRLPCEVDTEIFEEAWKASKQTGISADIRLACLKKALSLYRGSFLPRAASEDWVMVESTRYFNIYVDCVRSLVNLYGGRDEYRAAEMVCQQALTVDPFEETFHELLIRTYLHEGSPRKAVAHYDYASEVFYSRLGIRLSDPLRSLVTEAAAYAAGVEPSLDRIDIDLREGEEARTAYFCDYEVFRNVYRLEARRFERLGVGYCIALITLETVQAEKTDRLTLLMEALKETILTNLRRGDVVSRYSSRQYILLLPSATDESGKGVLRRITRSFGRKAAKRSAFLRVSLKKLKSGDAPAYAVHG